MIKYKIVHSIMADKDITHIYNHMAESSMNEAESYIIRLDQYIQDLTILPENGTILNLNDPNKRKRVFDEKYIVLYRILTKQKTLRILRVRHGAKKPLKNS